MNYHQMVEELSKLGVSTYNFKDSVKFRHLKKDVEIDVPRSIFPRKNASSEQCEFVFNKMTDLLNKHNEN